MIRTQKRTMPTAAEQASSRDLILRCTLSELNAHERLGTTGQPYHHLRQLVAAGWLRAGGHGRYDVPGERVVPLLVILAAARR